MDAVVACVYVSHDGMPSCINVFVLGMPIGVVLMMHTIDTMDDYGS